MKTLIVMRHGKAEAHSAKGDFARSLTHRGEDDAHKAGKHIEETVSTPDLIVASDAVRALSTARIAAKAMGYAGDIRIEHAIYEASVSDLLDVVNGLPDVADTVVLVGHNPGLEGLIYRLSEDRVTSAGLGTANFAQIDVDVDDWSAVDGGSGRIVATFSL